MKFLLDENIDVRLADELVAAGHDVTAIARDYVPSLSDRVILDIAQQEGRIVITKDRDFGDLVVRDQLPHAGILYLRMRASFTLQRARLTQVVADHADHLHLFLMVTESTVRIHHAQASQ